jgi:hypothetical protein
MEIKEQVQKLVYIHDLATLGIDCAPPDALRDTDFSDAVLEEHVPTLQERAALIAWDACFLRYMNENENGSLEHFNENLNIESYKTVTLDIQGKLQSALTHDALRETQRRKFLNLTRVKLKTQVRND